MMKGCPPIEIRFPKTNLGGFDHRTMAPPSPAFQESNGIIGPSVMSPEIRSTLLVDVSWTMVDYPGLKGT
jgi:hypothetical protein